MNDIQRKRRAAPRPLILAELRGDKGALTATDLMFALQGVRPPPSDSLIRSLLGELLAAGLVRRAAVSRPSRYPGYGGVHVTIWREAHVYWATGATP